jgi:20S proteasome alpha/beta subunit
MEKGAYIHCWHSSWFDHLCRFLSYVDLLGTTYSASTLATGYGAYIAQPLLRKAVEGKENVLTEDEARKILEDCMRVLFYRDARSLNKVGNSKASWESL